MLANKYSDLGGNAEAKTAAAHQPISLRGCRSAQQTLLPQEWRM